MSPTTSPAQSAHQSTDQSSQHAIVIGGSIAGLLAARVLSDHFTHVSLIERDKLSDCPESRKGQPQTRHLHGLLASGKAILERYFPDLVESLEAEGAMSADIAQFTRWHIFGEYRLQYESGVTGILCSRPFLEWQIRRRVLALPNLTVIDQSTVESLIASANRSQITGVTLCHRPTGEHQTLIADLVVDASGRHSAAPRWLADLGYEKPPETVVTVDLGYATRLYRRQPTDLGGAQAVIISADPPDCQRGGIAFPIEDDRWIVTLAGWAGDQPPLDEASFLAFAQNMPAPDLYTLIQQAEPLSEIFGYRFPSSLRRHYEKLPRLPEGYLVLGDALCSFDPVYGQGMSSAALQAALLDDLLQKSGSGQSDNLSRQFFQRAAKIIDIPWQSAVSEDFRFAGTRGPKPLGTNLINSYSALVQRATHTDTVVYSAFLKVMNLLAPPSSLFHPRIIWRVLRALWQGKPAHSNDLSKLAMPSNGLSGESSRI